LECTIFVVVHRDMGEDVPVAAFTKQDDAEAFRQCIYDGVGHSDEDFFVVEEVELDPPQRGAAALQLVDAILDARDDEDETS
jgi:hypothetical protein